MQSSSSLYELGLFTLSLNESLKFVLSLQVTEIFNFTQDDLLTEDIFILDCRSDIFVWVGQQVDSKIRMQALNIGEVRSKRELVFQLFCFHFYLSL